MRKQLWLFIVLLITIVSMFSFVGRKITYIARATYVEGSILQDTTWSRVDSPFVISNNVTVYPDAVLTVEPGVEVRFGENFSLIVNGRLFAEGREDMMIKFTSNNANVSQGDWGAIIIDAAQHSSLAYCAIEYGTSGIILENGSLFLQNISAASHFQSGIMITGGSLTIINSQIVNNNLAGIRIAGGSQIIIQDNVVSSNGDGMILTGSLTGEITIERNEIISNGQNGIVFESDAYDNTVIVNNSIASNNNGFRVATDTSTYISSNHILDNNVGILYERGNNHIAFRNYILNNTIGVYYLDGVNNEAHFNDIYSSNPDDHGMDVSLTAEVNATHNYWGHKSGPLHKSLNPFGKGNQVGGNGVNLDFLFFLTAPIDHNNARPIAALWTDKALVAPNQPVTFISTDSHDDGLINWYVLDFNDSSAVQTALSVFDHSYSNVGVYSASLQVIDDFNETSENTAVAVVNVQNLTPLNISVTLGSETASFSEQVEILVYVWNDVGAVANASISMFSANSGIFSPSSGLTNSSGYFEAVFTAPNVTDITDVRIICRASFSGYADGSDHKYLRVIPPLTVDVVPAKSIVKSEETTTIAVDVALGIGRPVADAFVIPFAGQGTFSPTWLFTDISGRAEFNYTSPQTLVEVDIMIDVLARKTGYADGNGQTILTSQPRLLLLEAEATPPAIIAGEASIILASVTSDGVPIVDSMVFVDSDVGEVSPPAFSTGADGTASFVYAAPQTGISEDTTANITMRASKQGYVEAETQITIAVVPKLLIVQITAQPSATVSEDSVNITAHVSYSTTMNPVLDANVTITSSNGGNFSAISAFTDTNGNASFVFTTPPVNEPLDIVITATVTKYGYVEGQGFATIAVNPGVLATQFNASSSAVISGEQSTLTLNVSCNERPVVNASVTLMANYFNISGDAVFTDSEGLCTLYVFAPETQFQLTDVIIVNVAKDGYIPAESNMTLNIIPRQAIETGSGFPWITLLLILIPVAIVVVVVVLIKLKVISVSFKGEELE